MRKPGYNNKSTFNRAAATTTVTCEAAVFYVGENRTNSLVPTPCWIRKQMRVSSSSLLSISPSPPLPSLLISLSSLSLTRGSSMASEWVNLCDSKLICPQTSPLASEVKNTSKTRSTSLESFLILHYAF